MTSNFLARFPFNATINWFPGHMAKATRRIDETIRKIDTVIELRDGRIPVSSGNPQINTAIKGKRRLIVMTKMDLCNRNITAKHIKKLLKMSNVTGVITADARNLTTHVRKQLVVMCRSREDTIKQVWLVCGMPNVGKSTFINSLIGLGKKAPTSSVPGWTRGQTFYLLNKENALLLDTPGIMLPGVIETEQALNLAVCGSVEEKIVPGGVQLIAEYLLYLLNTREEGTNKYMSMYGVDQPVSFFQELAQYIKKSKGKVNEEAAAHHFLTEFRKGNLGHYTFDPYVEDNL